LEIEENRPPIASTETKMDLLKLPASSSEALEEFNDSLQNSEKMQAAFVSLLLELNIRTLQQNRLIGG
jgi:hypothetical protein